MPPSLREIGSEFDLSVGTVQDQVEAIQRKGY
jgi:DNA-binding NarL/FixJ family response regulator